MASKSGKVGENMKKEKSKKDIAFDKERAKYRHEIKGLQRTIVKQLEGSLGRNFGL